jgi:hypothetical protein
VSTASKVTHPSATEVADELSGWAVGGGVVTMALFPLALPFLVLTGVALIPLLVLPLAAGAVIAPLVVAWRLGRRAVRVLRHSGPPQQGRHDSHRRSPVPIGWQS